MFIAYRPKITAINIVNAMPITLHRSKVVATTTNVSMAIVVTSMSRAPNARVENMATRPPTANIVFLMNDTIMVCVFCGFFRFWRIL